MGEIQKNGTPANIRVGTSPEKLLEERGVKPQRVGFAPQVPDYLGYALGLSILWLVYTGYNSVVSVLTDPASPVSQLGTRARTLTRQTAESIGASEKADKVLKTLGEVSKDISSAESVGEAVDKLGTKLSRGRLGAEESPVEAAPVEAVEGKGWTARQLERLNGAINSWSKAAGSGLKGLISEEERPAGRSSAGPSAQEGGETEEDPSSYEQF